MRGTLEPEADHAAQSSREIEALVVESRFGRGDVALRQVESMLPAFEQRDDATMLLHALYARALIMRRLGSPAEDALDACDTLEDAARTRGQTLWAAVACALRAQTRVDEGDVVAATADLARADIDLGPVDLASPVAFRLLDALAVVYARLRVHDRLDDVRERIESTIDARTPLERAIHWAGWCSELAVRAMEPVAMGEGAPATQSLRQAVEIGARIDALPPAAVPPPLRRGVSAVRALAAAYRGRPSEALRVLGQDAFGEARQLPPVERQIATLAAMRAHAHVGSIASARSLDDAAGQTRSTLVHLVLSVCRARERLWLETHAGGQVVPVLNRLVDLLVRLGWHGMDLVAEITRQSMEHHALREESRTDALTGVGNRRALDEELRQLVRFSQLPLSLVLVDVDDFKHVNDRFTHVVGDEVLRLVASSLSEQLRAGDSLLRYGGDEFVALLPATGDQEAHRVAARMARAVEALDWNALSEGLRVTVTTGSAALWSLTERRPDADAERLFQRADEALLSAKRRRTSSSPGKRAAAAKPSAPSPAPQLAPARDRTLHRDDELSREPVGRPDRALHRDRAAHRERPGAEPQPRPVTRAELRAADRAESSLELRAIGSAPPPAPPALSSPAIPAMNPAPDRSTDPALDRVRDPAPDRATNRANPVPAPPASLFNEPTSFVQPAPVPQPMTGRPFGPGYDHYAAAVDGPPAAHQPGQPPAGHPEPPAPPRRSEPPKAWEPGWRPDWEASEPSRDPLTGPLTGPLLEPLLDPTRGPSAEPRRPAEPSGTPSGPPLDDALPVRDLVHPDTDAVEIIDLTSGLTRRRIRDDQADSYQADSYQADSYQADSYQADSYQADSYQPAPSPPAAYPPDGYPANGHSANGYAPNGHTTNAFGSNGHSPNGYSPNGYPPPAEHASPGYPSDGRLSGSSPNGYPPNGYPPNGYPPNGYAPDDRSWDGHGAAPYRSRYPLDPEATPPRGTGLPPHRPGPPAVIDLTGHGLRRDRERLRGEPDDYA